MKVFVKQFFIVVAIALVVGAINTSIAQEGKASSQIDSMLDSFLGGGTGLTTKVTPEQLAAVDDKVMRYVYDPSVTAEVRRLLATSMVENGASQADADEQAKTFTAEFMQQWTDETFSNTGFQANDIADVMAMNIILNMVIAQQLKDGTPYQGDIAVRDMFKVSTANSGEFKSFSDREKQFFAESTMLTMMINIGDYIYKIQNDGDLKSIVEKAHADLLKTGIDSRMVMITEDGIGFTSLMDAVVNDTMTMEEAFPKEFIFDPSGTPPVESTIFASASNTNTSTEVSTEVDNETDTEVSTESSTETDLQTNTETEEPANTELNPLGQSQTVTNPLAVLKEVSPFVGSFSGDGLSLSLIEVDEGFSGELNFNGQVFPVEAAGAAPNLAGTFGEGANSFPFVATLIVDSTGDTLNFDSQGNVFMLTKEKVNPLGN